jgi:hypothetical protein
MRGGKFLFGNLRDALDQTAEIPRCEQKEGVVRPHDPADDIRSLFALRHGLDVEAGFSDAIHDLVLGDLIMGAGALRCRLVDEDLVGAAEHGVVPGQRIATIALRAFSYDDPNPSKIVIRVLSDFLSRRRLTPLNPGMADENSSADMMPALITRAAAPTMFSMLCSPSCVVLISAIVRPSRTSENSVCSPQWISAARKSPARTP